MAGGGAESRSLLKLFTQCVVFTNEGLLPPDWLTQVLKV